MSTTMPSRPPFPPFTRESAMEKVRLAEDAWNTRDPAKVALAYTIDSRWRNRSEFMNGRNEIIDFLSRKWARELDYRLIKEMWAFAGNRIAVRFAYEWHDESDHWYRSYGKNWEFNHEGLMASRFASAAESSRGSSISGGIFAALYSARKGPPPLWAKRSAPRRASSSTLSR
jgi:nuclear transport factor 2 (NTF2) superfamily protein